MKNQDLALLIIVGITAAVLSGIVSNFAFNAEKKPLTAESVIEIKPTFPEIEKKYMNENSLNPTVNINIGENENENPFASSGEGSSE